MRLLYTKEFQERKDEIVTQLYKSRVLFWISLLQLLDLSLPACDLFLSAFGHDKNMIQHNDHSCSLTYVQGIRDTGYGHDKIPLTDLF